MINATNPLQPSPTQRKIHIQPHHIKYYGVVFVCLMAFSAIKVFTNYSTIESSILAEQKETRDIRNHTQYAQLQEYMYSRPESVVFISHDFGTLAPWERIMSDIRVIDPDPVVTGSVISSWTFIQSGVLLEKSLPPRKSRVRYFAQKM
jgi:hypothetical protein